MAKLEIYPSRMEISPYTLGDCLNFEKNMSVWNKATFSYSFSAFIYNEEDQKLIIPRNVSSRVTNEPYFNTLDVVDCTNYYDESKEIEFNMVNQPRDQIQAEAIDFLMAGNKYSDYTVLADDDEKMLCLATGKGKTFSLISYLSLTKLLGMIIVDQETLMKQWYDEFMNHTDMSEEDIFIISGMDSVRALLQVPKDKLPFKAYIASHGTLRSVMNTKVGNKLINHLFNHLSIGVKVFDEAHVEWKNIILLNSLTDTKETVYLTATPSRSNQIENIVYQNVFFEVPKYGLIEKSRDEEKYQHLVLVNYNSKPSVDDQAAMKTKHGFNMKAYSDYIQNKHMDGLSNIIQDILDKHPTSKTAIIAHKNEMVAELADILKERNPNRQVGTFSGLIKNRDLRMLELEKDIIVSTDRSLSKAIDVKGLEVLISLNQYSSKVVAEQMAGRLRNSNPEVTYTFYDLMDSGFSECKKQRTYRKKGLMMKCKTTEKVSYDI